MAMTAYFPQVLAATRGYVLDVQGIAVPRLGRMFAIQRKAGYPAARGAAHGTSSTSWTSRTSQAPAPVSVRDKEVLIQAPSSRLAFTNSPVSVTTWPGRRCASRLLIAELSGITCVLALCEMITSRATGKPRGARQ